MNLEPPVVMDYQGIKSKELVNMSEIKLGMPAALIQLALLLLCLDGLANF